MSRFSKKVARRGATLALSVLTIVMGVVASPGIAGASGDSYVAVTAVRLLDTRQSAPVAAGAETQLTVTGSNGVAADASAVWINVTAVSPVADGHVTVYPCGQPRPGTANVNYTTGSVSPNAVLAKVGAGGKVCFWSLVETHLVVDLNGFVPAGGSPIPIVPVRAADTRSGTRPAAGSVTTVTIAGSYGVPADASAAVLNITAVAPSGPGHLTAYPCAAERPNTANVNYTTGSVSPNAALVGFGGAGDICIWTYAASDIVVDVMGYVPAGGTPIPIVPARADDTRDGPKPAASSVTEVHVAGVNGVPESATAVILNVTAVSPDGPGHLTVYPCGTPRPNTANVNYTTGSVSPNAVMSGVGTDGDVCVWTYAASHIVVDVMGFVRSDECVVDGQAVETYLSVAECDALIAIYNELGGPSWTGSQGGWYTPTDPCTWAGVTCEFGHVIEFDRHNRGLQGDVPALVEGLTYLTELDLSYNAITSLPPEIGSIMVLQNINLSANDLTAIPPEVGDLGELTTLRLNDNDITSLPTELGEAGHLVWLWLNNNDLSGDITPVIGPLVNEGWTPEDIRLSGNGCLTTTDATLAAWLDANSPGWNDGC